MIHGKEGDDKLKKIESDLGEIELNVRKNISDIFERGEKFNTLMNKSESLKTYVRIVSLFRVKLFEAKQ